MGGRAAFLASSCGLNWSRSRDIFHPAFSRWHHVELDLEAWGLGAFVTEMGDFFFPHINPLTYTLCIFV